MKLFQKLTKVLSKFKSTQTKFHLNGKEINLTSDEIKIILLEELRPKKSLLMEDESEEDVYEENTDSN